MTEMDLFASGSIEIHPEITQLEVRPRYQRIEFTAPGPQGPQGPPGATGGDPLIYDRNGIPAQIWTIAHNRGRYVGVTVLLDTGEEVDSDVMQDLNNVVVTFASPTSGKAVVI